MHLCFHPSSHSFSSISNCFLAAVSIFSCIAHYLQLKFRRVTCSHLTYDFTHWTPTVMNSNQPSSPFITRGTVMRPRNSNKPSISFKYLSCIKHKLHVFETGKLICGNPLFSSTTCEERLPTVLTYLFVTLCRYITFWNASRSAEVEHVNIGPQRLAC